ncbi:MAG TPA: hypothetical protein VNM14_16190 [Planctomycetota bacterium]|jgi:hypothetical protein|nr:hypothetical protein [Planctomycetota bacterium]
MKYSLLLLPFLASVASAQDDIWKTLQSGDRVQITFRSGNMLLGNLAPKPGDPRVQPPKVDYSAATEITLDLSLEYPGLNGTMTVPRKEIKEIRKLQNMDPATLKKIQDEMTRIKAQTAADDADRRAREQERDKVKEKDRKKAAADEAEAAKSKDQGDRILKDFADLQKGKALLERFPPEKYNDKTIKEAIDMGIRRQPIPLDVKEFADDETQRLWKLALKAREDAAASEKKDKEKEEKK